MTARARHARGKAFRASTPGLGRWADWHTSWFLILPAGLFLVAYFTGASVLIEVILGVGPAQMLNRELIGKSLARTLLILPIAGTPVAFALIWRNMYNPSYGIFVWFANLRLLPPRRWIADGVTVIPCLVLFDVWQWTPLIMLAGLVSLPSDL